MVEKNLQSDIGKFLNEHRLKFNDPFTFEVKLVKNNSKRFDFANLKPHQNRGLQDAMFGYYYKDSDAPLPTGEQKKHRRCDAFFIKCASNYVAVGFWIPRKHKVVYFVEIMQFNALRDSFIDDGKKSCHEDDIAEVADFKIDLLNNKVLFADYIN